MAQTPPEEEETNSASSAALLERRVEDLPTLRGRGPHGELPRWQVYVLPDHGVLRLGFPEKSLKVSSPAAERTAGGHHERRSLGSHSAYQGSDRSRHLRDQRQAAGDIREARRQLARERAMDSFARVGQPMRTTFYIASAPSNHVAVRHLADFLRSRGWRWAPGNAWGPNVRRDPAWVSRDMHAVVSADVFILYLSAEESAGAYAQAGARWGARRPMFGIRGEAEHHPLHDLPEIVWFQTAEEFAQSTFGA